MVEVVGPPDVYPNYGDNVHAWSPYAYSTGPFEFLELEIEQAIRVVAVRPRWLACVTRFRCVMHMD
jgi:hypothetical protein